MKKSKSQTNSVNKNQDGIKIKVYIEGHIIGVGKMDLFHLVFQKGSIRAAAKSMGMSEKKSLLPSEDFRRYISKSYFRKKRWKFRYNSYTLWQRTFRKIF